MKAPFSDYLTQKRLTLSYPVGHSVHLAQFPKSILGNLAGLGAHLSAFGAHLSFTGLTGTQ